MSFWSASLAVFLVLAWMCGTGYGVMLVLDFDWRGEWKRQMLLILAILAWMVFPVGWLLSSMEPQPLCARGHEDYEYSVATKTMQRVWICDERDAK